MPDLTEKLTTKSVEAEKLTHELASARASNSTASEAIDSLRVEIDRLNGLLDMIYRSRTWKVHTMLEKARGRG